MNLAIQEQRPPFVTFEEKEVEDRQASIDNNRLMYKSQTVVIIRAIGSRDDVEKNVDEWLQGLRDQVQRRAIPQEWLKQYEQKLADYRSGQEETVDGTHVRTWPVIDKATVKNLTSAGVLTVEDVAAMNEETIRRVGMNARQLKQKAADWLQAGNKRKAAAEIEKERARADNAEARIATLENQLAELRSMIQKPQEI